MTNCVTAYRNNIGYVEKIKEKNNYTGLVLNGSEMLINFER